MKIIYTDGEIADATLDHAASAKFTKQERLAHFGCAQPDADIVAAVSALEKQTNTFDNLVNVMVAKGAITSQRGNELKA